MKPDDLARLNTCGDVAAIADALRADPTLVSARVAEQDQLLHLACWQKQLAIFGIVLGYRADVNARGDSGRTPLHYAIHEGGMITTPLVAALIALGADPGLRDDNGYSVEDLAKVELYEGLAGVLHLLRGPMQAQRTAAKVAPAKLAELIEASDVFAVADALRADPTLALTTIDGETPLHLAAREKQLAIACLLLPYRPDLNARGHHDRTALHEAVHAGTLISVSLVGLLLAAGVDPNIKDGIGLSVEDWAKLQMSDGLKGVIDMLCRHLGHSV